MGDAPVRRKLTFRRLSGLDRSGPPPPETVAGAPLRPWTIPNAIGYVRLVLIPVFLVLALNSESGTDALPAVLYDDRDIGPGGKFADAELVGVPLRLTVGKRTLESGEIEVQVRRGREQRSLPREGVADAAADLWRSLP